MAAYWLLFIPIVDNLKDAFSRSLISIQLVNRSLSKGGSVSRSSEQLISRLQVKWEETAVGTLTRSSPFYYYYIWRNLCLFSQMSQLPLDLWISPSEEGWQSALPPTALLLLSASVLLPTAFRLLDSCLSIQSLLGPWFSSGCESSMLNLFLFLPPPAGRLHRARTS